MYSRIEEDGRPRVSRMLPAPNLSFIKIFFVGGGEIGRGMEEGMGGIPLEFEKDLVNLDRD